MKQFTVTPQFKERVSNILQGRKFTAVFPYMNLINREGLVYAEQELNQLAQFIGELPYIDVAEFFALMPTMVSEVSGAKEPISSGEPEQAG